MVRGAVLVLVLAACGGTAGVDGGAPVDAGAHDAAAVDAPSVDAPATDAPAVDAPVADAPSGVDGSACIPNGMNCTVDSDCCSGVCFVEECM